MTIGNELDQAFYNITQRLTRLEGNDNETVLGIEADLTSQIELLEAELHERIDELEAYKITEDEAQDIAIVVVRDEIGDAITENINHVNSEIMDIISDYVNDEVCELRNRVVELEARLNKPSFTARAIRWLREGPSIKEVATNWYAGIRRGS